MQTTKTILRINGDSSIEIFNLPLHITEAVKFSLYKETISISKYLGTCKLMPWQMVLILHNDNGYIKFESEELVTYIKNVFNTDTLNFHYMTMSKQVIAVKI